MSPVTKENITKTYQQPLLDLLYQAHSIYQKNFPKKDMQISSLLSIKSGNCPEDCRYCAQSGHYKVDIKKHPLLKLETVIAAAKVAKENGATRFCMGAAWRSPPDKTFQEVLTMIKEVKKLGLEACVTLGKLTTKQAKELKNAGLDFYNHNLDTSPEFYEKVITTRTYQERLETLNHIETAGLKTCCGAILGLGECVDDRISFLHALTQLKQMPESIPINVLEKFPGTPLGNNEPIDSFEIVRTIAAARIIFPRARIRLSAGRRSMSDELHALCFMAGANSIFIGQELLVGSNPSVSHDKQLLQKLGIDAHASSNG